MTYEELEKVAKEIHMKYYSQGKFGKESAEIKELQMQTGCSKKEAKYHIEKIIHPNGVHREFSNGTELNFAKRDNVARCPKCKSTSISYDTKKLSVGRGVVGGLIGGATGNPLGEAVGITLGGLTSKKGYCVCLNCGKRWKI